MACVLLLGWGAAGAATPQRAEFRVTLTGTLTKDWTVQRTGEGDCPDVTTHAGRWRLTLGTRAPSKLAIVGPSRRGGPLRISRGVIGAIAGRATQTGSRTVALRGPRCLRSTERTTCTGQQRSLRGASVRLRSPAAGKARFDRLQRASAVRSFRADCPEEPSDIRAMRTDLNLADAPLDASDVFARDVPRFFISGNTEVVTTLEGDYDGRVVERVRWTLTFTRVR